MRQLHPVLEKAPDAWLKRWIHQRAEDDAKMGREILELRDLLLELLAFLKAKAAASKPAA